MLDDSFVVQILCSDDRAETQESPPIFSRETVPPEEEEERREKTDHHIPAPVEQEQCYPATNPITQTHTALTSAPRHPSFESHGCFTLQIIPSSDYNDNHGGTGKEDTVYDSIMEFDNEELCFSFGLNVACGTRSTNSAIKGDEPQRKKKVHDNEDNEHPRKEATILKAILDHFSKNGTYPFSEFIAFHGLIKSSLDVDVSASQLMKDIEGLKGTFDKIVGDQKGLDLNFSRACDQEVFELSKKIWECESENIRGMSLEKRLDKSKIC